MKLIIGIGLVVVGFTTEVISAVNGATVFCLLGLASTFAGGWLISSGWSEYRDSQF